MKIAKFLRHFFVFVFITFLSVVTVKAFTISFGGVSEEFDSANVTNDDAPYIHQTWTGWSLSSGNSLVHGDDHHRIWHLVFEYKNGSVNDVFCLQKGVSITADNVSNNGVTYYGGPACIMSKYQVHSSPVNPATTALLSHENYAKAQKEIWDLYENGVINESGMITDPSKVPESCKDRSNRTCTGEATLKITGANEKLHFSDSSRTFYVSDVMTISYSGLVKNYGISISGAPDGTKVIDAATNEEIDLSKATSATKIYLKIPVVENVEEIRVQVSKKINQDCTYTVPYYYYYGNGGSQKIGRYEGKKTVSEKGPDQTILDEKVFVLTKTQILIEKQDYETKKLLPGATLVITDREGNLIQELITSDKEAIEILLESGEYMLVEKIQPEGYTLVESALKFTITSEGELKFDDNKSNYFVLNENKIIMYNEKVIVKVPDTGSGIWIGTIVVGFALIGVGSYVLYFNKKKMYPKK